MLAVEWDESETFAKRLIFITFHEEAGFFFFLSGESSFIRELRFLLPSYDDDM